MLYIEYINDYPSIPDYLLESTEDIINKPRKKSQVKQDVFQARDLSIELHNWLKSVFDFEFIAQYQVIYHGLPIHKDIGRNIALNYLLDTGGINVSTSIYDDDYKLLQSETISLYKWHKIITKNFHGVDGLTPAVPRIAISLHPINWSTG